MSAFVSRARSALHVSCFFAPCLLAPSTALAQSESIPGDTATLPRVIVVTAPGAANGEPLSGESVTSDEVHRKHATETDTAAILASLAGVSVNTGGGFASMPTIHGMSEQRITILVDGQPIDQGCPNDMNTPLSYTNPQSIAAIRVTPGVAPVSMGGDNIAGVISVSSAPPRFATAGAALATGSASGYYRSNGDAFGTTGSLTLASRTLSATWTGSYVQSDNYSGGGSLGKVRSTEYAKTDQALALAWQNTAGLFELKGSYHHAPYEGFVNQYMDMTNNTSWTLRGRYRGSFGWGNVDLSASYRDVDHMMNFLADKLPGAMPMVTKSHMFTSAAKLELPLSAHDTLLLGAEYHHERLDDYWPPVPGNMMMGPGTFQNINGAHRDRLGAYAEWNAHFSSQLSGSFGMRYDRVAMDTGQVAPYGTGMMQMADVMAAAAFNARSHHRTDDNWSGSALITWTPDKVVSFEFGYARKVRSPNVYERYTWGRGNMASQMIGWFGDGNGYVGNLDLKPERADTLSATLVWTPVEGTSLKVSPYYTHVSDYIDAVVLKPLTDMMGMSSPFVQLQFANIEASFHGIDVSGQARLAGSGKDETLLTASLGWGRGTNLSQHVPLYHQMPLDIRVGVSHHKGPFELGGEVEWVARKDRVDPRRNEPVTAAYALVNLNAAYTLGAWRLGVEAKNLFDKSYYLPLGGVSLGDYKATGTLRPVPGMGRSVNVSLSTRF